MNVEIRTEAAIPYLGIFLSNFWYCVFAVHAAKHRNWRAVAACSTMIPKLEMAQRVMTRRQSWLTLRVHTEWKPPLSGVHSIMMEKLVQAGEDGGGARPPPFTIVTIAYKVTVYAPAEWADTLTLFHLYRYMYSVGSVHAQEAERGYRTLY
jgi:hypothetical protein